MKELSKIRSAVAPSATLAVNSKFKQMKAEGIPVVGFGAGEPDFDTPDHIKEAGIRAIQEGQTKYTPTPGTIEARKAVAYRMKEDLGVDFDYDAIVISNGAKACLYATFFTLLDTGDEGQLYRADPYGRRRSGDRSYDRGAAFQNDAGTA